MSHMMRTLAILISALLLSMDPVAVAQQENFEAGLAAKNRGHYATALRAWMPLAQSGMASAQNNIGHMHEEGLGVVQNYTEAMRWYRLAADSGLAEAQHNIGLLYYHGYGVSQNQREALRWFRQAADQKLAASQYMIGRIYHAGEGLQQDFAEARRWYALAARSGYAEGQFMYAFMLQAGEGATDGDPYRAYIWSQLAERNGLPGAQDIHSISALMLTAQQLELAAAQIARCLETSYAECAD